jgi:hypothetical protein
MSTDTANRQPLVPARLRLPGAILALAALAMAAFGTPARANMVSNGSFSFNGSAGTCSGNSGTNTQQVTNSSGDLPGWTTDSSYTYVLDTSNYGNFSNTYNGNGYSCIGLQPTVTASPLGGSFLASDPAYLNPGPYTIATSIGGLITGATYTLTFDMAGGQQTGFTGSTDDWWTVGLTNTAGVGATQTTPEVVLTDPENCGSGHSGCGVGFSGWVAETMQFVAGAATQALWFMGGSTAASGQPPFVLLDGVNLTMVNNQVPVPEPPAYAMLMAGLLALLGVRHFYRRKG